MKRKSSNATIKMLAFIFIPIFLSNIVASLIGLPHEKTYVSIHNLQFDIIWITISTIFFLL